MRLTEDREIAFPNLTTGTYRVTSAASSVYNCLAWAACETEAWWWPDAGGDYYWPSDAPREETIEAFVQAYRSAGYTPCPDAKPEPGMEKAAIYADATGNPTHAAKQSESGAWTSKLGNWEDIEHASLSQLQGPGSPYGTVVQVLKRPRRVSR